MLKTLFVISFLSFIAIGPIVCVAQVKKTKYEFSFVPGIQHTLAQRGPKHETEVSKVKFLHPIRKSIGGMFNIIPDGNLYYGLEFSYDEFNYGYVAESHNVHPSAGVGISSGLLSNGFRVALYKAGLRAGYSLYNSKKLHINTAFIPSMGYFKEVNYLNDTSSNITERKYPSEILYIKLIPDQREGFYLLLKGTAEVQYNWSEHFATSFMFSYQQGFSPFIIDTVNIIRPYEYTGLKEHKYYTKVNGTGLQWHLGFKYTFGSSRQRKDSE